MDGPFRVEMLAVWLIRAFVADLAEHMAAILGGDRAARLDPDLRRTLGIGNATGLGMAPFLVNHPDLLNNWIAARETAIARVWALPCSPPEAQDAFAAALAMARQAVSGWRSGDPVQAASWDALRRDLAPPVRSRGRGRAGGAEPMGGAPAAGPRRRCRSKGRRSARR